MPDREKLRIAGIVKESVVDGEGLRLVIFTQGCLRACEKCHNLQAQPLAGGYEILFSELVEQIKSNPLLDGITFSGGEPFLQAASCARLAKLIKEQCRGLNIWVYSGYYHEELLELAIDNPGVKDLLEQLDVLIDGPYENNLCSPELPFRGSSNQRIVRF